MFIDVKSHRVTLIKTDIKAVKASPEGSRNHVLWAWLELTKYSPQRGTVGCQWRGGLMVSAQDSGSSGPGSRVGGGTDLVKIIHSRIASLYPCTRLIY